MTARSISRRGFSLPEILVVVGIIALLLAILFPAASAVLRTGKMTSSMSNLRSIAEMMALYQGDNNEHIVPSQFDYSSDFFTYKGKVRSEQPQVGVRHQGTWTDILWTENELASFKSDTLINDLGQSYQYDSPDKPLYDYLGDIPGNPFRSTARNFENFSAAPADAKPYGPGAHEVGEPGYLAANNFFSTDAGPNNAGRWWVLGQMKAPERSLYVIDSFAGETIEPIAAPWETAAAGGSGASLEVDFRHNETALILYLDGHAQPEALWVDLPDLESRGIRIRDLHQSTVSNP